VISADSRNHSWGVAYVTVACDMWGTISSVITTARTLCDAVKFIGSSHIGRNLKNA
jgi:hypothetical protein